MIEYLKGKLAFKSAEYAVIECNGVGYEVKISLNTYADLPKDEACQLYTHFVVREDAQLLYGFMTTSEREVFRKLISVSGVGPNTARMILSTLKPGELADAISKGDVNALKSVKGIGAKSAQRIIVDLKDKMGIEGLEEENSSSSNNTSVNEALTALVSLGFDKRIAKKALDKIVQSNGDHLAVEELIRLGLKSL